MNCITMPQIHDRNLSLAEFRFHDTSQYLFPKNYKTTLNELLSITKIAQTSE